MFGVVGWYLISLSFDIFKVDEDLSLVIWHVPFRVLFSYAELS